MLFPSIRFYILILVFPKIFTFYKNFNYDMDYLIGGNFSQYTPSLIYFMYISIILSCLEKFTINKFF